MKPILKNETILSKDLKVILSKIMNIKSIPAEYFYLIYPRVVSHLLLSLTCTCDSLALNKGRETPSEFVPNNVLWL